MDQPNSHYPAIGWQLLGLGSLVILAAALSLTIAPAVRERSWGVGLNWQPWIGVTVWLGGGWLTLRQLQKRLSQSDPYIFPLAWTLIGLGLLMVWRLSPYHGIRQTAWLGVALMIIWLTLRSPQILHIIQQYKYVWLVSGLVLTALTLIFGRNPSGSNLPRLWLGCCGLYFQPSEPLKLLLIVYLSAYLAGSRRVLSTRTDAYHLASLLAPTALMSAIAIGLLIVQRDLGTASIFFFLYAVLIYLATEHRRVILIGGLGLLAGLLLGYGLFDVVRLRVDAWLNPWLDPSGRSFQIVQSLIAIANGGIFGRGLGLGSPGLVPVAHSDFIFAALAEETGLCGSIAILILIGLLAGRTILVAINAHDEFQRFLTAGFAAFLGGQSLLIIAGNLRLLPLTGVTLPFVSYGGSSLLVSCIMLVLILLVSAQPASQPGELKNPKPYLYLGGFLFTGIGIAALASGWFAVVRSPVLLNRTDNPRRAINDRYVARGGFYDQQGDPIVVTTGKPGSYQRVINYPPLSVVVGHSNPVYGQSGLEKSLDDWLRGYKGYDTVEQSWSHLLYGMPPPGLHIRLTLNLDLQRQADAALGSQVGTILILNAQSGEILAIASHPSFDANTLEQDWTSLTKDQNSPFLNRAVQGQYPYGDLSAYFFPNGVDSLHLEKSAQAPFISEDNFQLNNKALIQPIKVAYAAAAMENRGIRPPLILISAVKIPNQGWVAFENRDEPVQVMDAKQAEAQLQSFARTSSSGWQFVRYVQSDPQHYVTWFVGGSQSDWKGTPVALVILLEENNPRLAEQIGEKLLNALLIPQ